MSVYCLHEWNFDHISLVGVLYVGHAYLFSVIRCRVSLHIISSCLKLIEQFAKVYVLAQGLCQHDILLASGMEIFV